MSKVLPFPFLVKVWNGSAWQMPSVYRFPSGSIYDVQLYHSSYLTAFSESLFIRESFGVDACVFLHDACLSGELSVPCYV